MDWISIEGVKPYDGRYELDLNGQPLTTREWGWAKRYANYLPLTIDSGAFADPEMVAVLAIVALHRNGKIDPPQAAEVWERLQDAPFGSTVVFEGGPVEEDDDGSPPPENSDARPSSNGDASPTSSETSGTHPSRTGPPRSATSGSDLVTSAT